MLTPQLNIHFSTNPNLFNLRIWRIKNPGKSVRKRNPQICLKKGMFRSIAKSVKTIINIIIEKYCLAPKLSISLLTDFSPLHLNLNETFDSLIIYCITINHLSESERITSKFVTSIRMKYLF